MSYILDTPLNGFSIFLRSSSYTSNNGGQTTKSNLTFELNTPILCKPNMNLLVGLKSFSFTNSFYTVNDNNDKFYYTYDNLPHNVLTFTCEHGNYTIDDLINYLNTQLLGVFIFSYSLRTLKITITSTTNTPFRLISKNNTNMTMYELLGFPDNIIDNTLLTIQNAPYLFNMIGVQVLHICISNLRLESIGVKNQTKYNIIDSVQVTATSGETQTYFNDNGFKYKIYDDNINFLDIVIRDQDFNIIDFNNIDWFINLNFNHVYQKDLVDALYLKNQDTDMQKTILLDEKQKIINSLLINNYE